MDPGIKKSVERIINESGISVKRQGSSFISNGIQSSLYVSSMKSGHIEYEEEIVPVKKSRFRRILDFFIADDPFTSKGRCKQLTKIITVAFFPIIVLLIHNSVSIRDMSVNYKQVSDILYSIEFTIQSSKVVHNIQLERGTTVLYVSSGGDLEVYNLLAYDKYIKTEKAIKQLPFWPNYATTGYMFSKDTLLDHILNHRKNLKVKATTTQKELDFYTDINTQLILQLSKTIQKSKNGNTWKSLVAFHMLIVSKELGGIERAFGSTYFTQGKKFKEIK